VHLTPGDGNNDPQAGQDKEKIHMRGQVVTLAGRLDPYHDKEGYSQYDYIQQNSKNLEGSFMHRSLF